MRLRHILAALTGGSIGYGSWLALRPLTEAEKDNWNSIYMEDQSIRLRTYRRLPLNAASRLWGACHHASLPRFARRPVYSLYAKLFNCDLTEAASTDLAGYRNLSEFFRRPLKPEARPVCPDCGLVSPADGTVLHLGRATADGRVEQVKGVDYTLQGFLGPSPTEVTESEAATLSDRVSDSAYFSGLKSPSPGSDLYQCVIYLSPGDYHRFHSPADWLVAKRRHFPGYLMSVSPGCTARIRGLFCLNERAAYLGTWRHGFFSYVAVGATNVGSINVYPDPELSTNRSSPLSPFNDVSFSSPLAQAKGQLFGEFDLGSTVVLIFEAPSNFAFSVAPGQRVKVGQALGNIYA